MTVASTTPSAYFTALGSGRYLATEATGGAWDPAEQHIAPSLGLLVHALERSEHTQAGPGSRLSLSRLCFDIYGVVPIAEVEVASSVLRPGRTIELSEATLSHAGRTVAVLRAWALAASDTHDMEISALPTMPAPETMELWNPDHQWPGGFIRTLPESRHRKINPGRAQAWARSTAKLVAGEETSALADYIGLIDVANGAAAAIDHSKAAYPNVDSTVSLFRHPKGKWVGLDVTQSAGPGGVGLTHTVLHDEHGPLGTLSQTLTIRRVKG
ncbi:thioesterase family protein [Nesterenkonia ebinurensis]|uniref:thioesterase family protein n=1 Tax=Nesterenkonia ebinurensis TaxID=2608252 RepID=UPI00123CEC92|nr:thioesterase family protein [Nesterenkonia ebinurensis]